jgi:type II secretory pathway predicted ATPase ExeA
MTGKYAHLHRSVGALADEPEAVRIKRIRTDRWIGYSQAERALAALEDLLTFPKRMRMPNLLLIGPTNNGKTMITEKFRRSHPGRDAATTENGTAEVPVLRVQMPPAPDERRFFSAVLAALGAPDRASDRLVLKQDFAMRLLRATGVQILIIDEAHNLLSGTAIQQRRFLNLVRWLGNELQIPLVAVGTAEALRAIQSDDRFSPFTLPLWHEGEEYRRLLSSLEALLPLRRPSGLAEPPLAGSILSASEGVLGEIVTVVTSAAVMAVTSGEEAITEHMIARTGFVAPSRRKRIAV